MSSFLLYWKLSVVIQVSKNKVDDTNRKTRETRLVEHEEKGPQSWLGYRLYRTSTRDQRGTSDDVQPHTTRGIIRLTVERGRSDGGPVGAAPVVDVYTYVWSHDTPSFTSPISVLHSTYKDQKPQDGWSDEQYKQKDILERNGRPDIRGQYCPSVGRHERHLYKRGYLLGCQSERMKNFIKDGITSEKNFHSQSSQSPQYTQWT